jgi:HPt (histidine-containing phosphotransfer) domain-containing protein
LSFEESRRIAVANNFNEAELLDRVDNDVAFLAETVDMLTADGPPLLEQVRTAVSAGDAAAVARHAHALKGMVSNFAASRPHACAAEIEKMGRSGDLSAAGPALDTMQQLLDALSTELVAFAKARS